MSEQAYTGERLQSLTEDAAYKALHYLTRGLSVDELQYRLFGMDHRDPFSFSSDKMLGNPESGYCFEVSRDYHKAGPTVKDEVRISALYGADPKRQRSGDLIDLHIVIDVSQDVFQLVSIKEGVVGSKGHAREEFDYTADTARATAILSHISNTLDAAEEVPDHITDEVKKVWHKGDYHYAKIGKKIEKQQAKNGDRGGRIAGALRRLRSALIEDAGSRPEQQ